MENVKRFSLRAGLFLAAALVSLALAGRVQAAPGLQPGVDCTAGCTL
ncbi:MAG: hypothetical protein JNK29_05705, partial [Anaerolineales bacterium]|nr:hypothetical protein [Anaerolineales bacterium]